MCGNERHKLATGHMVEAQYQLVAEHLKIGHVRLVTGNSMGGMHTRLRGAKYPNYMDVLAPMASPPTEMASRNDDAAAADRNGSKRSGIQQWQLHSQAPHHEDRQAVSWNRHERWKLARAKSRAARNQCGGQRA